MDAVLERALRGISISPISPLTFTDKVTEAILTTIALGAPFRPLPAPSLGATAPITLAGALAQQHAELLASFAIAAAAQPGAAVSYSSRLNPVDMRSAISAWGGPELGMASACAAQLAHRIGFACNGYGLATCAGRLDPQFAYERFGNALVAALGGVDILSGVGGLESGLSAAYEAAVIDDEMIGMLKYIVRGCRVDETALAFDVMQEVIPGDRVFLGHVHTVRQMRAGALWRPGVSERAARMEDGPGLVARARARASEILRTHVVELLPESVDRELTAIVARAARELVRG